MSGPRPQGGKGEILHASCVALGARAVLITGAAGAGKSALALELMALGAGLVADDRTVLSVQDGALIATCPAPIRGRIEARGIGILSAADHGPAAVVLAVDLDRAPPARLPGPGRITILGVEIDLICAMATPTLAPAILQYLKGGRAD